MSFGPKEWFLVATLALLVAFLWAARRYQQSTNKEIMAQAEEANNKNRELIGQVIAELKGIRILLEKDRQ